jgi:RNA polymerase sigma-70 factor (ECF subfamily)
MGSFMNAASSTSESLKERVRPAVQAIRPMAESATPHELIPTRDSLLSRLKDWQDDVSWRDFFNTYWRLVYGVALKAGLSEQEAQEVVQETVITVARRIPEFKYNPNVCSFKTWLLNLTRWRIVDQLRKRQPASAALRSRDSGPPVGTLEQVPDPAGLDLDAVWAKEWQAHMLQAAIRAVKRKVNPEQYQIFHLCVFKEWPAQKVTRELGISSARVYLAKHRVAAALKREIKALEKKMNG